MRLIDPDVIGDEGEDLARLRLRRIAFVNKGQKDIGLDFRCELRESPQYEFWVQAKGKEEPDYDRRNNNISSLPVSRRTIEDYWLEKLHPVFLVMSDTRRGRSYFLHITQSSYRPRKTDSNTHVFQIPLENELTKEKIGALATEVIRHQPRLSPEVAEAWVDNYRRENPLLFQDIDQIAALLEIMRGPDQSAQVEAKFVIKELYEAGELDSERLLNGLIEVFRNCRERITQNHVVETLVFLEARRAIPEVIRQIKRNLELPEYKKTRPGHREQYTSFLFAALVRLKARAILPDLREFFDYSEPHIVRQAVSACGALGLKGGARDLLGILSHPDRDVRIVTAYALSQYGYKYIKDHCVQILRNSSDPDLIHGAIYTLAYLQTSGHIEEVVDFARDRDSGIRSAVAHYLGLVDATDHADLLVDLILDDDPHIQSRAGIAFVEKLSAPDAAKERLILPKLEAAFEQGEELKVASLLGPLSHVCSEESIPVLRRIYWEDDGRLTNHQITDSAGNARGVRPIDLKSRALRILTPFELPEIEEDIVRQIDKAEEGVLVRYINWARDLRLPGAFDAIIKIKDEHMLSRSGAVITALMELDSDRACKWALAEIEAEPSFGACMVCCSIIKLSGRIGDGARNAQKQLWRHFQDPAKRLVPGFYTYLRDYRVTNVTPIIIEDLEAGTYARLEEKEAFQLIRQMLETLAIVGGETGRDYLISLLADAPPGLKLQILNLLAGIADEPSMEAIRNRLHDPDYQVRALADRLVQLSSARQDGG